MTSNHVRVTTPLPTIAVGLLAITGCLSAPFDPSRIPDRALPDLPDPETLRTATVRGRVVSEGQPVRAIVIVWERWHDFCLGCRGSRERQRFVTSTESDALGFYALEVAYSKSGCGSEIVVPGGRRFEMDVSASGYERRTVRLEICSDLVEMDVQMGRAASR